MKKNLSHYSTLLLFLGIVVFGLFFGLIGLVLFWGTLELFQIHADFWLMTEAIGTAVTAAGVFGAAFVAHRELSEVSSTRHMEVANQLFGELNSAENVAARRWIFQNLPEDPQAGIAGLSKEGRDSVKKVLNSLDHVAFLTQSGWIPEEILMPWMHPMIAKAWEKLGPYVLYERQRRHEPDYYVYAGRLAEQCKQWRKRNLGEGEEIRWVKDAL